MILEIELLSRYSRQFSQIEQRAIEHQGVSQYVAVGTKTGSP